MGMQTDVYAAACAANTTTNVTTYRARIKGILLGVPTAGGTVSIVDGTGGATLFSFVAPAVAGCVNVVSPGEGILAEVGIRVTTPADMTATVFYG